MLSKLRMTTLVCGLAVCFAIPAFGQGGSLFDIDGDVDGDGIIGTTDIQHVINGALGLRDRGADAVRSQVRQYIVASPRAALMTVPQLQGSDAADRCNVAGAAFNFPRDNGRILIRTGGTVIFRYDRNAEGVIYPGACGGLRSELVVEARRVVRPVGEEGEGETDPVERDANARADESEMDRPEVDSEWVLIGRDAVEGRGCGPEIGVGNVAVRAHFKDAGAFVVRATIRTYAIPAHADGELVESDTNFCGAARSVSEVFVGVRVVSPDVDPADLDWEDEGRVDPIAEVFARPLDHELDSTMMLP